MLHCIVNPSSGKGRGKKTAKKVEKLLTCHGVQYTMHYTQKACDGEEIARKVTTENQGAEILVVGGDGTFHEVLNGLQNPCESTLGFLPAGRGNDFARTANLTRKASDAVQKILRGEKKYIDYIDCDGRRCLNVAGTGLDIDVLERVAGRKGKITYLYSLVYCLHHFTPYKVSVTANGETTEHDCIMVGACNGIAFGGGITLSPLSKIDDGKMNVIVMRMPEDKKIMKVLPKFVKGKHMDLPITTHIVCDEVNVISYNNKPIQLDGEIYRDKTLSCKIVPHGLRIFV